MSKCCAKNADGKLGSAMTVTAPFVTTSLFADFLLNVDIAFALQAASFVVQVMGMMPKQMTAFAYHIIHLLGQVFPLIPLPVCSRNAGKSLSY